MYFNNNRSGFTLVELLVVITIIGILAALLSAGFITAMRRQRVDSAKENIASYLQSARNKTVTGTNFGKEGAKCYGVKLDTAKKNVYYPAVYPYDKEKDGCQNSPTFTEQSFPRDVEFSKLVIKDAAGKIIYYQGVEFIFEPPSGQFFIKNTDSGLKIEEAETAELIVKDKNFADDSIYADLITIDVLTGRVSF